VNIFVVAGFGIGLLVTATTAAILQCFFPNASVWVVIPVVILSPFVPWLILRRLSRKQTSPQASGQPPE